VAVNRQLINVEVAISVRRPTPGVVDEFDGNLTDICVREIEKGDRLGLSGRVRGRNSLDVAKLMPVHSHDELRVAKPSILGDTQRQLVGPRIVDDGACSLALADRSTVGRSRQVDKERFGWLDFRVAINGDRERLGIDAGGELQRA